jgi:hypothetical protein
LNPGRRGGKPATNRLSYSAAPETALNNALSETLPTALISAIIFNAYIVSVTDNTIDAIFVSVVAYFATLSVLKTT